MDIMDTMDVPTVEIPNEDNERESKSITCPCCNGKGIIEEHTCGYCNGDGCVWRLPEYHNN